MIVYFSLQNIIMLKYAYLLPLLGTFFTGFAQQNSTLESPLKIPIHASGNFGELRGSHFHAGLDIKTQQREGIPVYAPMDGYVSRIKVSAWGYGKALYIAHPNGQTTVYGHLSGYAPDIDRVVRKKHYSSSSFEIEVFPPSSLLKVKKGDLIAYTGNTGGSGGPHLHYEVRDSGTQEILNPLAYGMGNLLVDTKAPTIKGVYVYPVGLQARINSSQDPRKIQLSALGNNKYKSEPIRVTHALGIGVDIFDTADFNTNKNGVYKVEVVADGKSVFEYVFDKFSFSESGFVNVLTDYGYDKENKTKVQKLFVEVPYGLSVLNVGQQRGIIEIQPGRSINCNIILTDFHNNQTVIDLPVNYDDSKYENTSVQKETPYKVIAKEAHDFALGYAKVSIPSNSIYTSFYLELAVKGEVFSFHKDRVASLKNMTLTLDINTLDVENYDKAFIGLMKENAGIGYNKTTKEGNLFSINTKTFGDYKIFYDTQPPTIKNLNFSEGQWISNAQTMRFSIIDELSGIKTYKGLLNGNWILFEYDYKTNKITYNFSDNKSVSGRNDLEIEVIDNLNNKTVYKTHFFRK